MHACATLALALFVVSADPSPTRTGPAVRIASNTSSNPVVVNLRDDRPVTLKGTHPKYTRSSFDSVLRRRQDPAPMPPMPASAADEPMHFHGGPMSGAYSNQGAVDMSHGEVYEDGGFCPDCCGDWHKHKRGACLHAWFSAAKPDMPPHTPYRALPAEYYYFRPYNVLHIPQHQEEVILYGEDPRMPYANTVFSEDLYEGLDERNGDEPEMIEPSPMPPMVPTPSPEAPSAGDSARRSVIRPTSGLIRLSDQGATSRRPVQSNPLR